MKALRYALEGWLARGLYTLMRALPLPVASAIGSAITRALGPFSKVHKVAQRNLRRVMPELDERGREEVIARMWDNLGRTFCEYPHLNNPQMLRNISVQGEQHLRDALNSGKPIFIISGHLGNWELPPVLSSSLGMKLHLLYRSANNKVVDDMIADVRRPYTLGLHDKGRSAARAMLAAIKAREPVAMLIDQKTNDGVAVPFFGIDAMSSDVVAHLVLKYDPIVLPSRCVRVGGCRFRIEVEQPMEFALSGDTKADERHIMTQVHDVLERWIKEDPAQWFWVHKRWPFSKASD